MTTWLVKLLLITTSLVNTQLNTSSSAVTLCLFGNCIPSGWSLQPDSAGKHKTRKHCAAAQYRTSSHMRGVIFHHRVYILRYWSFCTRHSRNILRAHVDYQFTQDLWERRGGRCHRWRKWCETQWTGGIELDPYLAFSKLGPRPLFSAMIMIDFYWLR